MRHITSIAVTACIIGLALTGLASARAGAEAAPHTVANQIAAQAVADHTGADQAAADQTGANRAAADQAVANRAATDQAAPDQTAPDQTAADQTVANQTVANRAAAQTLEEASKAFIQTYMERWSAGNAEALAFMDGVFLDKAVYFNRTLTHAALMQAKRRFAERWPVRRFVVRTDALSVSCDERRLCTVWGLVDWLCRSTERQAQATGTSVFAFQLQDGRIVVDEDGFVIARGRMLPREEKAAVTPTRIHSNEDISRLRRAFYNDSTDPNWIAKWLAAQEPFAGVARSMGQAGARQLADSDGSELRYAIFQSDQGSIACMTKDERPLPASGAVVRLRGTVAIFIDETMYLSSCSFS